MSQRQVQQQLGVPAHREWVLCCNEDIEEDTHGPGINLASIIALAAAAAAAAGTTTILHELNVGIAHHFWCHVLCRWSHHQSTKFLQLTLGQTYLKTSTPWKPMLDQHLLYRLCGFLCNKSRSATSTAHPPPSASGGQRLLNPLIEKLSCSFMSSCNRCKHDAWPINAVYRSYQV